MIGVGDDVVVDQEVVADDGRLVAIDGDAVGAVLHEAALDEQVGILSAAGEVGDDDAAHTLLVAVAQHHTVADGDLRGGGEVDLRIVAVVSAVEQELAVLQQHGDGSVGSTADARALVLLEDAVAHHVLCARACHVDGTAAVSR